MFQLQICLKPKQRDLKSQADTAVTDRSDSSKMVSSRKPFVHNRILSFLCRVALCDMRCDKLCHWYVKALYQEVSDPPCRVERVVGLWPRTSAWSRTHGMGTVIWRLCSGTGWLEVPASAWQSLRHRHERQGSGRLSGRRTRSLASNLPKTIRPTCTPRPSPDCRGHIFSSQKLDWQQRHSNKSFKKKQSR